MSIGQPRMGDGLALLKDHLDTATIADLIAKTARWVDPETFRLMPLWYPEYARGGALYNAGWTVRRQNRKRATDVVSDKVEGNSKANAALTSALGLAKTERPNWSCCHIWGIDDPTYSRANTIVQDHRYFSCLANMLLLPAPLKAFTDVMPEIKAMLRQCAADLYGWQCDHADLVGAVPAGFDPADYPQSWRAASSGQIPGIMKLSPKIQSRIVRRKAEIAHDLDHAGEFYPREAVRAALDHWKILL